MRFSRIALASSLAIAARASPVPQDSNNNAVVDSAVSDAALRAIPLTREGMTLRLNGTKWQSSGANVYWLGLDENVVPLAGQPFDPSVGSVGASYPTHGRITEVMNTVRQMGGKHIRGHTLGISYGHELSLWPTLNTTNEEAWDTIDFAIYSARQHGLRLQIPLVDNYDWFHGGKYVWLRWYGIDIDLTDGYSIVDPRVMQFYTNETIVAGFKSYLTYWLTHVNQYTGLTIAEDPTVAILETGNELGGPIFGDMWVPNSWTQEIAQHVNSFGPGNKLIMDGTYGVNATHFAVEEIDCFSNHYYPLSNAKLEGDLALVETANRTYFAGEFDWTGLNGGTTPQGDAPESWYAIIQDQMNKGMKSVIAGDSFWSLFMHDVGAPQGCQKYVNHTDGFTLHYADPSLPANTTLSIGLLRQHAYAVKGQNVGLQTPGVGCPGAAYESGGS